MDGFRLALEMIGFVELTRQLIIENVFLNIISLATVNDNDITELIKHIGRWNEIPAAVIDGADPHPPSNPSFHFSYQVVRYVKLDNSTEEEMN